MSRDSSIAIGTLQWSILLALLVVSSRPAAAITIEVPSQYPTIQAAIDTASSGDIVLIAPGVYVEKPVLSGKVLTLASHFLTTGNRSYIGQTIIDGNGGTRVVRIGSSAEGSSIIGLTIRNGDDGVRATGKFNFLDNRVTDTRDGIDFAGGSGGLVRGCVFEGNADDAIDCDNEVDVVIENNTLRNNGDDGIEIRFQPYIGPQISVVIRNNTISGNDEDGIQLIGYEVLTSRTIHIERNLILNNAMAGIGMMCCENTIENYQGSNILERVGVFNNTIVGNNHGLTGGDSVIVLNNIFMNTTNIALKKVDAGSIAAYNLFFANGADTSASNVDMTTTLFDDPVLLPDYGLGNASPAIDAGIAFFEAYGETVWSKDAGEYFGAAPDLGAVERMRPVSVIGDGVSWGIEFVPPLPNPSRGSTALRMNLPAAGHVRLEIVDVAGRQMRVLVDGIAAAGWHDFSWDGRDASGRAVPAGVYFARLKTAKLAQSRRFVRLN